MAEPFDREVIARIFDEYGDAEWARHEASPFARVSFHVHRHYLHRFVRPGDQVLEVGAGAGRFTVELARLGARVTVVDISPEQLRLNEEHLAEVGPCSGPRRAEATCCNAFGRRPGQDVPLHLLTELSENVSPPIRSCIALSFSLARNMAAGLSAGSRFGIAGSRRREQPAVNGSTGPEIRD